MSDLLGATVDARWLLVGVTVFAAGFMRGFIGFGAALVSVPIMSLVIGPQVAVAVVNLMGVPALMQLLPEAVRGSEHRFVGPMCLTAFFVTPIGTWLLVAADPAVMKIAISVLVLVMVGFLGAGWMPKKEVPRAGLMTAGVVSGLIQGIAGMGGPPVVGLALSRPGTPQQQRANVLALMSGVSLSSVLPMYFFGLFTQQALLLSLALFPLYSGATWLGSRHFHRGGAAYYRRAALTILACVGVGALLSALRGYFVGQ